MCEPAIHVLRSVFTRLARKNASASVATLRVFLFVCLFVFFFVFVFVFVFFFVSDNDCFYVRL